MTEWWLVLSWLKSTPTDIWSGNNYNPKNGKTLEGANNEWWTNNPDCSVSISKWGERQTVFEAHTAKWNFFLELTVNMLCYDVLCFMTLRCLSNRYFAVQFYNKKQKETDSSGLYIYIFAARQIKSYIRKTNLYIYNQCRVPFLQKILKIKYMF